MKWLSLLTVLVSLSLMQQACVTRGEVFSSDYSWIEEGKTSQKDMLSRLGEPFHVGYSAKRPTWTYGYYSFRLVGESSTKELTVYWDDDGLVDSFSFKSSFPEDKKAVMTQAK